MLSPPFVSIDNLTPSPPLNFEQRFLFNCFPYSPLVAYILNNATASPLPEKSNSQPYLAVKESMVMQNSFNNSAQSSSAPHGTANPSPEVQTSSEAASFNRDKVVPINSAANGATADVDEVFLLRSELAFMRQQLAEVKAALLSAQEDIKEVRYADRRTGDRIDHFERSQKQAQIKQSQIRHAQDQQMERRLQDFIKSVVTQTMHNAIQKFVRLRSAGVPEPARMPSTYSVPKRTNTGIYS